MRGAALLLDLDGTIYEGDRLIAGADPALRRIRAAGVPVRFVTNTTRKSRRMVYEGLRRLGLHLSLDELCTAPSAAATYLKHKGYRRILPLLQESTLEDFADFEIVAANAEVVVVGDLGEAWNFPQLNKAFRALMNGADLVAIQKNRYWKEADGLSLDAGPFVVALEYASGKKSVLAGKPSKVFFEEAARSMNVSFADTVMVGDDVRSDVGGALDAGGRGILVRTGKFTEDEFARSGVRPDAVIDSIADLPEVLGL